MVKEYLELYDFQTRLKSGVESLFPSQIWLKAEISSLKSRGRHCYMELSQSGPAGLVAKISAVIWESRYRFIAPYFESVTGSALQEGITVMVRVQVSFSQLYGLTLVVTDIDPEFSLGEQERLRQMTISRLQSEGVMDLQKSLELPVLPVRFAVISAEDAAGYRDFARHLEENPYGFQFSYDLYPAAMQGVNCPASIIASLDEIVGAGISYDAVLILRGGGSRLDLSCYDDYELASSVAQFPLPVITAIGHDQDFHVIDMVAHRYLKTPTALADALISIYESEDERLSALWSGITMALSRKITESEAALQIYRSRLRNAFMYRIVAMESAVNLLSARISGADPRNVLKRGYALALDENGVVLKNIGDNCHVGGKVGMMFHDGTIHCVVEKVEKKKMI